MCDSFLGREHLVVHGVSSRPLRREQPSVMDAHASAERSLPGWVGRHVDGEERERALAA